MTEPKLINDRPLDYILDPVVREATRAAIERQKEEKQ